MLDAMGGGSAQYIFISSASAYEKPVKHVPVTEATPLRNPFSGYVRDKIACEDLLVSQFRDHAPTWNQIYAWIARAAGVPDPEFVHVAS